jgi:hypothetical protein
MKPKSDSICLCIDPLYLNRALLRDHYQMPTIDDILPDLTKAKVLSTFDCKSAFWHLQLDEPSSMLTVFSTPFGKYRWLRLPYGITLSPELFQRRLHEALSSLQGVACIADRRGYTIGDAGDASLPTGLTKKILQPLNYGRRAQTGGHSVS